MEEGRVVGGPVETDEPEDMVGLRHPERVGLLPSERQQPVRKGRCRVGMAEEEMRVGQVPQRGEMEGRFLGDQPLEHGAGTQQFTLREQDLGVEQCRAIGGRRGALEERR